MLGGRSVANKFSFIPLFSPYFLRLFRAGAESKSQPFSYWRRPHKLAEDRRASLEENEFVALP
jgi:hypothetical protein